MAKYLFNSNIHGYELSNVRDFSNEVTKDDTLIIIIDKSCETDSVDYYRIVDNALRERARIILIGVDDNNKVFDALASNMLVYREYNIYKVVSLESISAEYLLKVQERTPDLDEAIAFLPSDIIAYSDIQNLLLGIESLVDEGNMEGLKTHVERHLSTVEGMLTTINKMKKTNEMFNSNELIDNIKNLKETIDTLNNDLVVKDKTIADVKYNRDAYQLEVEKLKRELGSAKAASSTNTTNEHIIKTYNAYNTSVHANNKALVIYFKEISYVRYMNTLVTMLCTFLNKKGKKFVLLIYDNNNNMIANYGLPVTSGDKYSGQRSSILNGRFKTVVTEPFQTVIQDAISSNDAVDIVIVYDRLRQYEDIVKGNNVTKFFVANSKKDIDSVMSVKSVGMDDTSFIITSADNSYEYKEGTPNYGKPVQFLDIPGLGNDFSKQSDSAKLSKYLRLKTARTDILLMGAILKKSHVDLS